MTNEATLTKFINSKHINKDSPTKKTDSSLLLNYFHEIINKEFITFEYKLIYTMNLNSWIIIQRISLIGDDLAMHGSIHDNEYILARMTQRDI